MFDVKRLSEIYHLNETDQSILLFLNQHHQELRELGIREVAKACFTSTATIMNVAKKLNLSGYSELVFRIIEANRQQDPFTDDFVTRDELNEFHEILSKHQDSTIVVLSTGFSKAIASYINDTFNFHFIRSITTPFSNLIREHEHSLQNTLVLFVSHSGEEKDLNEVADLAIKNNIDIISFVGARDSSLGKKATLTISTDSYSLFSAKSAQPQIFFGKTLIQFEMLVSYHLNQIAKYSDN